MQVKQSIEGKAYKLCVSRSNGNGKRNIHSCVPALVRLVEGDFFEIKVSLGCTENVRSEKTVN